MATAFDKDRSLLEAERYAVRIDFVLPGFVRTIIERGGEATRVDWARDSAWRFMPLVRNELGGWLLHPVDVAINKVIALAGRDEARDFVDTVFVHRTILAMAGLVWAAVGKDPGLTPLSLLDLLRRHGRARPDEIARLQLAEPFDLVAGKQSWESALSEAERFARERPPEQLGCLYYSRRSGRFVIPDADATLEDQDVVLHLPTLGGVTPRLPDQGVDTAPLVPDRERSIGRAVAGLSLAPCPVQESRPWTRPPGESVGTSIQCGLGMDVTRG